LFIIKDSFLRILVRGAKISFEGGFWEKFLGEEEV